MIPLDSFEGLLFLDAFAQSGKALVTSVTSVRLSACISAAVTGRIFVKFDIEVFYENLSRSSRFG